MFGSEILDVAIGLVLMFLLLSLVCSSIKEAIETVLHNRAQFLEHGLREMFGDLSRKALVPEFYRHPLINGLFRGQYQPGITRNLPSYIPAHTFSVAVLDLLSQQSKTGGAPTSDASPTEVAAHLESMVAALPDGSQLKGALRSMITVAKGDMDRLRAELEDWYNGTMDRVAGWYKQRTQIILAAIALALAATMNVDSLAIVRYLNTNQTARLVMASRAEHFRTETAQNTPSAAPNPGAGAKPATTEGAQNTSSPANPEAGKPTTTDLIDPLGWLERQGGLPLGWTVHPQPDQTPADYDRDWRRPPSNISGWLFKI